MITNTFLRSRRVALVVASVLLVSLAAPVATRAASRRARLSRDLADRLTSRLEAPTDVIVTASDATTDQLAIRYGARLKNYMRGPRST